MNESYLQYVQKDLCFGYRKIPLTQFIKNYHRPIYIYDLNFIERRYQIYKKNLPEVKVFYAMKANSNLQVLKKLCEQQCQIDVVSGGEIQRATQAGFSPQQIIFSGVGKTKHEIREALDKRIYQINVESLAELVRIADLAKQSKLKAPILLRLNPDVDIKTHPHIATGLKENKFGMDLNLIAEIYQILRQNKDHLELLGISMHLGSQMLDLSGFAVALKKLKDVYVNLKKDFPSVKRFNVGGGLGIYYNQMDLQAEEKLLEHYAQLIHSELGSLQCEIQSEPGRWLVAHAGVYVCQVQYVKQTQHKCFLILDGGMNHLMRPVLYDAFHQIHPLVFDSTREQKTYDVVGPICESADFFGKDRVLQETKADEFVVIADTGAYGFSMANQYNLQELPLEIAID